MKRERQTDRDRQTERGTDRETERDGDGRETVPHSPVRGLCTAKLVKHSHRCLLHRDPDVQLSLNQIHLLKARVSAYSIIAYTAVVYCAPIFIAYTARV